MAEALFGPDIEEIHILLIDDNPDDRELVIRELKKEWPNIRVTHVKDQDGFSEALEKGGFDLVITDYQLHWITGLVILRAVKTRYLTCPVIMFTGTGNEEIAVAAMKAGLDDYVIKTPKHFARLPGSVANVIRGAHERMERIRMKENIDAIFHNLPIGIYRTTVDGRILFVNNTLSSILGYRDADELMAINTRNTYANPEERERWLKNLKKEGTLMAYETTLLRKDGTRIRVRDTARAVRDDKGDIMYIVGAIIPIVD